LIGNEENACAGHRPKVGTHGPSVAGIGGGDVRGSTFS
jgi:hypothetical protein